MSVLTGKLARVLTGVKRQPNGTLKARRRQLPRAERRNAQFGRKPIGNTTPVERRAIWAMAAAEKARAA